LKEKVLSKTFCFYLEALGHITATHLRPSTVTSPYSIGYVQYALHFTNTAARYFRWKCINFLTGSTGTQMRAV